MTADTDDWNRHWHDYAESASQNPAQGYGRRVVVLRGRRLITDVAAVDDGGGVPTSGLARLVMPVFGVLFRGNLARTRLGWHMVAAAHLPR